MQTYGTSHDDMAAVAISGRKHAQRNDRALMKGRPLTREQYYGARFISEPFRLYDCCLETDGGGAIVLTSLERARDLKQAPVVVKAAAQHAYAADRQYTDTAAKFLAPRLWAQAGMGPGEMDVAQIYDHFAPFVVFALEDYGFVERGEGGPFVESGGIAWDGGLLPVNTSGGHLSEAYMQGMNQLLEGVRQARGTSTTQVRDAAASFVDTGIGTGAVIFTPDAR
jgi:acetyl-CoA acetyltransferase